MINITFVILSFLISHYCLCESLLKFKIKDAQCGFKFFRKETIDDLVPFIKDERWFWDTEMLYFAHKKKHSIKEIPVVWDERKESKVKILRTILTYLIKIADLKLRKVN